MKPKTINETIDALRLLKKRGYGDHILLVSDDEECNGFHALYGWYSDECEPFTFLNEQTNSIETKPTIQIS